MGARQVAPLTFFDGKQGTPDGLTEFGPVIEHVEGESEPIPAPYAATSGSYRQDVLDAQAEAEAQRLAPLEELVHPLDAGTLGSEPAEPVLGLEDLDDEGDDDDFFAEPDPKG